MASLCTQTVQHATMQRQWCMLESIESNCHSHPLPLVNSSEQASHMDKYVRVQKTIVKGNRMTPKKDANVKSGEEKGHGQERGIQCWDDVTDEQTQFLDLSKIADDDKEGILRLFDVNARYGPFAGIDRVKRLHRARSWGLNPPILVCRLLESEQAYTRPRRASPF